MRKLLSAVLLLCASVCAYGQGATVLFPPAVTQQGNFLPFAKITFCTTPATLDTLGNCTNTVSVFKDQGLTQPYSSSILTDGIGYFPPNAVTATSLWFSPAANLCFTLTTSSMLSPATNPCTPFSVSVTPGSSPSFTNLTVTNTATINTAVAGQINKSIWVDGTKYPVTQAGIQQAFTDACAITGGPGPGTDVYLPPMSVGLFNVSGQQFLVTCNLHIHGAGDYATQFVVAAGIASTVPEFRFKPNNVAAQSDILIEGIEVVGNTSGGDAFFFDGTGAGISGPNNFVIRKTRAHGLSLGAWAVNESGQGGTQNGWNIIENNTFAHGINLSNTAAVDSWLILHNVFGSDVGNTTPCVNASTQNNGASHITLLANNGGCAGGFFISHGTHECKILYNQIEQPIASVEANSAIIDLIGDTFSIDQCEIRGNNIGPVNLVTNDIRLGIASGTIIAGNTIGLTATTGVGIVLTASSSLTFIDQTNTFVGVGGGAVAITNATGANPFTQFYPKADGTLPAQIRNATDGGLLFCSNGGACWTMLNGGTLFSPAGTGFDLNGGSTGATLFVALPNAGGTVTPLEINSGTVAKAQVASDFTTANNTSLQTITGLSWTVLANARNLSFHCSLAYSQATAAVSDTFGIQVATNAPTNVFATGKVWTNATGTNADGVLATLSTTTATNIVTFTPSATTTNFVAELNGTIELPASANTINIMVSTSAGADAVTVKRGSYCELF